VFGGGWLRNLRPVPLFGHLGHVPQRHPGRQQSSVLGNSNQPWRERGCGGVMARPALWPVGIEPKASPPLFRTAGANALLSSSMLLSMPPRRRAPRARSSPRESPLQWPKWKMFAATVAFLAWAFVLPNNPFSGAGWYSPEVTAFLVLVVSAALGLLAPIFNGPLKT
jgi:hypothetical protein